MAKLPVKFLLVLTFLLYFVCEGKDHGGSKSKRELESYTVEKGQAQWLSYKHWHRQQQQRALNKDCKGITYLIYKQQNGFGDDIGAMTGVLKHAFRIKAVYVVHGWLAKYLSPVLNEWDYQRMKQEGLICDPDTESQHIIVPGHVHMKSPVLKIPDVQSAKFIERHMHFIRSELIAPRNDLARKIQVMQRNADLFGKLVVGMQIRTGQVDKYGSPKFLGATRAESSENAKIFFECASSFLDVLDRNIVNISEDVRFFIATDDPDVVQRAREDPRIGHMVVSFVGDIIHSVQATEVERTEANALKIFADFFTLTQTSVLFKTSTSLFGSQASQLSESARLVYTVNDPLCGIDGNKPIPDTVQVWRDNIESFRVQRLINFGTAPLNDSCSSFTVLENVYGARSRPKTIGTAPTDRLWPSARTLFRDTHWQQHSEL